MDKEKIEEIKGYISRFIPDIARKCSVHNSDVIEVLKEFIV